jgi:hypothetical protein
MTQSNWCNQNYWYLDDTLSTKSTFIPRDAIDDTNIVKKNYTYVIAENACFQKIPSLVCNNLNIIGGSDTMPPPQFAFTCALLEASNVTCGLKISLSHWEPNTFCEWTVSSLSTGSGCAINYLILDANSSSGTGLNTTFASVQNSYIKTNNLYLDNTSISSSSYITKILCTSGTLVSSTINDRVICEGDFSMSGTTNFGGSGNGSFVFNESSINAGTINGSAVFNDSSINQGIVYSNVLFSGASSNNGIVVGDCVFLSGTKNLGIVSGNALFSGSSINSGTIISNGFFNSGSINFGIVSGISKFDYAINNGTISESYFTRSTNGTDGVVTGSSSFNQSINSGILNNLSLSVDFSFVNNSINKGGTIFGNVVFDSGCTNRGLIYNTSGYVIFKKDSINYGNIGSNSITFTDDSQNGYGDVTNASGLTIFSKNAINYGTIGGSGSVEFYNLSLNNTYGTFNSGNFYHSSINRGTLNIAYFYQDAANFKTVSSGIFNGNSINKPEGSGNNLCFNNSAINSGLVGIGNFADSSYNYGTGIYLQFCHRASNSGTSLGSVVFWGNSTNLSGAINNQYADFYENSKNYSNSIPDCRFVFHDKSINYANVYSGIFLDFSKNSINTTGYNLNFYDDSSNNGTITNLGLFMGRSLNKGIVLNSGIFYNLSSNRPPAVIQDSLFLHYSSNNSSYKIDYKNTPNMDTPRIVFSGYSVNQGNIVDSYVQFGDHAINKNSIEWNSKLLFASSGIFIPGIDQDGKEKYFHFSGPDGTYETDVSEFIREFYNCKASSFYSWPQMVFRDYSQNLGNLKGYYNYIFNNYASNYGSLYTYPVIPNLHSIAFFDGASKQSGCLNAGSIVNGKTVFNNSINSGTVLFPYFENSTNYGDILGVPTLSYYPYICNGFYLEGVSGVQFINSTNFGRMDLFGSFEESINFGNINSSGSFDNSKNFGFIANNAVFINSYSNGDIGGNLDMTNSTCISSNIRGKANFINSTYYGSTFLGSLLSYQYYYERNAEDESWIPNINDILNFMSLGSDPTTGSSLKFDGDTISNDVNFINSKNFGGHLMKSAYFQNGINFGDIEGFSHFVNSSVNAYNSTLRGISIFEDSTNYGILNAKNFDTNINGFPNMYYNEYIIDSGILINYPQLSRFISSNKIGSILDNSTNKGTINTPSILIGSINYYYISQPTTFIYSNNNKNNNVAYGYNEAISYIPPYPLYSPPIYIYRYNPPSTETYSRPHIIQAGYGLINSNAIFINSDNNAAVQNSIFYQSNNNGIVQGEATLNNSWNYGSIIGENTTFKYSTNYNEVSGNAIFISGSNGSNGLVTGDAVFVSGSCNSVFARVLGQITNDGTMSTNC